MKKDLEPSGCQLLTQDREWRKTDEVLVQMAYLALAHAWDIKAALNITISEKDTPIAIAQKLLFKIGLKNKNFAEIWNRLDKNWINMVAS